MRARDVLVVDDTEDCRLLLRKMLETRGFTVRTAASGRQALVQIEARRPDVVLLDVMMPDMTGHEVLEHLRADPERAFLPVILVTARGGDEDLMVGYQTGADYYITKPFTARQLLRGIAIVLGESSEGQADPPMPASAA